MGLLRSSFAVPAWRRPIAPRPMPIPGAQWQAGVTAGNERYRVLLDGQPVPLAFAAAPARGRQPGWVFVFADPQPVRESPAGGALAYRIPRELEHNPATGNGAAFTVLRGQVRIVLE